MAKCKRAIFGVCPAHLAIPHNSARQGASEVSSGLNVCAISTFLWFEELLERQAMTGNVEFGAESMSGRTRDLGRSPGASNHSIDPNVCARVHELLLLLYPPGPPLERRTDRRYPYPQLIRLTPIDENGRQITGKTIAVAGKTLSERGVGFYHPEPLPYRRMVASFHAGDDRWLGLIVDISWCRFTGMGWYESGGRFLQAVSAVNPVAPVSG
jgi:hypothetical protein